MTKKYLNIVSHYEACFEKYGDSPKGVDWPNADDAQIRHSIMLDVIKNKNDNLTLLDFGCGLSHLYDYIKVQKYRNIKYSGLDISRKFINKSKQKYPQNTYYCYDILKNKLQLPKFDYIIANGVFTEKQNLTFTEMFDYTKNMINKIFNHSKIGLSVNFMSHHVDWTREDLFHLPFDKLANFLRNNISKNFTFRQDYGLYEYTTYIYK